MGRPGPALHRVAAGAALLGIVAGWTWLAGSADVPTAPGAHGAEVATTVAPAATTVASTSLPTDTAAPMPTAAAPAPRRPPAMAPTPIPPAVTLPYRYMGSTGTGPDAELIFFGRGRTVMLRGPGALDDEYVIESVIDQRLQWRHLPSGASQFMPLAVQQPATTAGTSRPEDFPRD